MVISHKHGANVDATVTPSSLAPVECSTVYLSGTSSSRLSCTRVLNECCC